MTTKPYSPEQQAFCSGTSVFTEAHGTSSVLIIVMMMKIIIMNTTE